MNKVITGTTAALPPGNLGVPAAPVATLCDGCFKRTFTSGANSVVKSVYWLNAWSAPASSNPPTGRESFPVPETGLLLVALRPYCLELHCEPPLRRDHNADTVGVVTQKIHEMFEAAWRGLPELRAALETAAISEAVRTTLVPRTGEAATGLSALLAAFVANNLLWPAHPSAQPLQGIGQMDVASSSKESLDKLEAILDQTASGLSLKLIGAGDVLAIHVLCTGLQSLLAYVQNPPKLPPRQVVEPFQAAWPIGGGVAAGAAVVALLLGNVIPLVGVPMGLALGWKLRKQFTKRRDIEVEPPEWIGKLRRAAQEPEYQATLQRLQACDLLASTSNFCAGTRFANPAHLAAVLRTLWLSPAGDLVLARLVSDSWGGAGNHSESPERHLRLAILGETLLEQDQWGEGLAVVSMLLGELLAARQLAAVAQEPKPWRNLATEGGIKVGEATRQASLPRFIAEVLRRAGTICAAYQPAGHAHRRYLEVVQEVARKLLIAPHQPDDDWVLLLVRCVDYLSRQPTDGLALVLGGGMTMEDLYDRVEEIYRPLAHAPSDELKKACAAVLQRASRLAALEGRLTHAQQAELLWWSQPAGTLDELLGQNLRSLGNTSAIRFADNWLGGPVPTSHEDPPSSSSPQPTPRPHRPRNPSGKSPWQRTQEPNSLIQAQNLQRWVQSGHPRQWVVDHHGQWNSQDWESLLATLKHSEFWPMEPNEVGRILEELKTVNAFDLQATPQVKAQNLQRWEQSGLPRNWVEGHRGQWTHTEWDGLLEALKQTNYWPMEEAAIRIVLQKAQDELKNSPPKSKKSTSPASPFRTQGKNKGLK